MAVTEESKLAKKVEEQTSEIKFSEDELKSLGDLNTGYQTKQTQFGQLGVQRILLQQKLEAELNEKYGPGQLDPNTGVFTPNAQETTEQ